MKRVIGLVLAFVMCFALVVPAFATGSTFVPSITAKPAPELSVGGTTVKVDGTGSNDAATPPVIEVKDESDNVVHTAPVVDLIVTAVAQVQAEGAAENVVITEEAVEALQNAYEQLNDENFKFSEESPELLEEMKEVLVQQVAEQLTKQLTEQGVDAAEVESAVAAATAAVESNIAAVVDNAIVTALFDVSILSDELNEHLDVEGNTIDLTFTADIPEDHNVIVLVHKENKWQTIDNVVVNGDGTITCTFEHFCPVAIVAVPMVTEGPTVTPGPAPVVDDATGGFAWWWIVVVVAAVVVVAVVAKSKGSKKTEVKK